MPRQALTVQPVTQVEAEYLVDISYLAPLDEPQACFHCASMNRQLDIALLLKGVEATATRYKIPVGSLKAHYTHLTDAGRYLAFLKEKGAKLNFASGFTIEKILWVEGQLFKSFIALAALSDPDPKAIFKPIQLRLDILKDILNALRIEGEMTGQVELARTQARMKAEKEAILEGSALPEEEQLRLSKALLRRKGYVVTKEVGEEIDGTSV